MSQETWNLLGIVDFSCRTCQPLIYLRDANIAALELNSGVVRLQATAFLSGWAGIAIVQGRNLECRRAGSARFIV